jgi:hypothetical protein
MNSKLIKSLSAGLIAALAVPVGACASPLTNKSPARAISNAKAAYEFTNVSGGVDGSGGGSVIACTVGGKKQFKLLDYYEAEQRQIAIDLGPKNLSVEQKLEFVLNRYAQIHPQRANEFKQMVAAYEENVSMRTGVTFGKTPDVVDEIIPTGCDRVQVVIQINPELPGDKRFITNASVWNQLDNDTKAGLILHEISYYHQGMKSARKLRYFNGLLSSSQLTQLTAQEYAELLTSTSMPWSLAPNAKTECFGDASFSNDGSLAGMRECKTIGSITNEWISRNVDFLNADKYDSGRDTYFNWRQEPITVLSFRDLYGLSTLQYEMGIYVLANSKNEIQLDEMTFRLPESTLWGNKRRSVMVADKDTAKEQMLFSFPDNDEGVLVTTKKESRLFKCADHSYYSKLFIERILRDKIVMVHTCEEKNKKGDNVEVTRRIEVKR